MRVIAGIAKGRRLVTLKGTSKRPTSDRVKESIFSVLGERIPGTDVVDLFAGTGNLGIEALSRGARSALFVDNSIQARERIEKNLHLTQFRDRADIWRCDCYAALRRLHAEHTVFDLIFADPPYGRGIGLRTLRHLDRHNVLKPDGAFVLEHPSDEDLNYPLDSLEVFSKKTFGHTRVHFYRCIQAKE